jgi:large subunit ribosomal protein L1
MKKRSKKYVEQKKMVDPNRLYPVDEAVAALKKIAEKTVKFDQSIDVAINLGVDPKQTEQSVRGAVVLPAGSGKPNRILVFAKGEKEQEARDAGADYVGSDELIEKVKGGWMEFDTVIATPQMMGTVGKLGKILGRKGLMPNPKTGTVTMDVAMAVSDAKKGRAEFKLEKKGAVIHTAIGKISFKEESIRENLLALLDAVVKAKPPSAKGTYIKKISISTTMSPAIRIDPAPFSAASK